MLTVAMVCVEGGNYKYTKEHIFRLTKQVSEHLSPPYEFYCIAVSDKPGWWAKIDLFKPGAFEGRVLYLDLDVTVVGDLDRLVNIPQPFAAMRDGLNTNMINSSVMVWDAGTQDHIYTQWTSDVMEKYHGDQNWINKVALPSKLPKEWCPSWKYDLDRGKIEPPPETKVIVYHGRPKPWEIEEEGFNGDT